MKIGQVTAWKVVRSFLGVKLPGELCGSSGAHKGSRLRVVAPNNPANPA